MVCCVGFTSTCISHPRFLFNFLVNPLTSFPVVSFFPPPYPISYYSNPFPIRRFPFPFALSLLPLHLPSRWVWGEGVTHALGLTTVFIACVHFIWFGGVFLLGLSLSACIETLCIYIAINLRGMTASQIFKEIKEIRVCFFYIYIFPFVCLPLSGCLVLSVGLSIMFYLFSSFSCSTIESYLSTLYKGEAEI